MATLLRYRLTFAKLKQWPDHCAHLATGGGPLFVSDPEASVCGVAYQISEQQFDLLDGYERAWGYFPIQVVVQTSSGTLQAVAHNLENSENFAPPSDSFLTLMTDGLREHGYHETVVRAVERASKSP